MMKKILLINILIILYFINIEAMNGAPSSSFSNNRLNLMQSLESWKKLSPLSSKEMRIYNKTWNYQHTLARNKSDLVDTFCDICCDFSFRVKRRGESVIHGGSSSNPNIIFIKNITDVNPFIVQDPTKYAVTNFLDNAGEPREFSFKMREQMKNQIRVMAEDAVGCKLLRIMIAKTAVKNLSKLIFIPVSKNSETVIDEGMNVRSGIYGWQIESDRFVFRMKLASTMNEKISEVKNRTLDFQKYAQMKLPNYRYILFSFENFFERPTVAAIKNIGSRFIFFNEKLPPDVTLFRTLVRSLYSLSSDSQNTIKTRLGLKKKKYSRDLNQKFSNVLKLMVETECITEKLTPQIFKQIRQFGIRNYANHVVETMSQSARLKHIEDLVSSYYGNDEEYRAQYGLTAEGFDSLNESMYLSHRYRWIRASNLFRSGNFGDMYKSFIQEQGDFDLYSYYLSPNSSIKYPKFGVNQYQYEDDQNFTEIRNRRATNAKKVKFLMPEKNGKSKHSSRA